VGRKPGGTSRLHLQTLFRVGVTGGLTDRQLLERFATQGGEAAELAFAALVERHSGRVYHACRGILEDEHEAHDAFQATFLVLLRKRNTLSVRDSLGPWLHRVPCRAAGRARVETQRRRVHERRAAEHARGCLVDDNTRELAAVLHEEVDCLPDRYRMPIVLCDLQGRSYEEAAQHLGCPVGTVLTVCHDIVGVAVRVVAVDQSGGERTPVHQTGGGVKDFHQIVAEFDLGPEAIQEYRLQTQGYERVEFPGVALKPDGPR
jgi:RNA polymerase sigma factor (sigma-70 family)